MVDTPRFAENLGALRLSYSQANVDAVPAGQTIFADIPYDLLELDLHLNSVHLDGFVVLEPYKSV